MAKEKEPKERVALAERRAAAQRAIKAKPEAEHKLYVPLDQDEIREIDADITQLRMLIRKNKSSIIRFVKMAQTIDAYEAKHMKVLIQVHDIKNGATEVANYFGLAEMTLENMHQDMNAIFAAKDEYMRKIYEQQEKIAEQAAIAQKNREEAKRLAEKRKAEKAAQENENNNQ